MSPQRLQLLAPRPSPGRHLLHIVGRTLLFLFVFETLAIVVFRRKWRPAMQSIRRFNKNVLNPVMLRLAGRRHWYASVIHHVGRSSGKSYATPIWAERVGEFFYIPLPYGVDVDWSRNVLAADSSTVESRGVTYRAANPEIVPAEKAARHLPWRARTRYGVFGVEHYLRLKIQDPQAFVPAQAG